MSSYFRTRPIFIVNDQILPRIYINTSDIMSPEDIDLICSIINEDINNIFNNVINRIQESNNETITEEQFSKLKVDNCLKECPICFLEKNENIELKCNHSFCKSCIKRWLIEKKDECPLCREKVI